jgi:hypothetical protein
MLFTVLGPDELTAEVTGLAPVAGLEAATEAAGLAPEAEAAGLEAAVEVAGLLLAAEGAGLALLAEVADLLLELHPCSVANATKPIATLAVERLFVNTRSPRTSANHGSKSVTR